MDHAARPLARGPLLAAIAGALLGLGACSDTLTSSAPLLSAGGSQPEPGLWAVLSENCTAPATARVQDWPECATPAWIKGSTLTMLMMAPTRMEFMLSDGAPRIVRVKAPPDPAGGDLRVPGADYSYYAIGPASEAPFRRATLWDIPCRMQDDGNPDCAAGSGAALRAAAAQAVTRPATFQAVFVAPAG